MWNRPRSEAWLIAEAQEILGEINKRYAIDSEKIILAGFSMGGLALELALSRGIKVLGIIRVASYIAYKYVDPESNCVDWIKTKLQGAYLIVGEQGDFALEEATALAACLPQVGIRSTLERHANLGHEYPTDFANTLTQRSKLYLRRVELAHVPNFF